ncbi:uncharacterized protein SAPINGB_P003828 [Magnusiomyces paraingens]|uniref:Peptidase A1 domain-containing protein n=1 Tax=Magnusiomyces paraingens TaxID=2606893 RepID=A0A5E8BRF2_9ASCO|nr:uncharacterized protein SAPINGB_P003828 [Saprochaete ingens]VVT53943.1 unnamed protein product [Saprochaete ingens]
MNVLLFLLSIVFPVIYGAPSDSFSSSSTGVIQFETIQNFRQVESVKDLVKRSTEFNGTIDLKNYLSYYTIDFKAGTPFQNVSTVLDTGSSDLWFYDKSSGHNPYFDSKSSSTYFYKDSTLFISYGSGPVKGDWGTEVLQFGNAILNNSTIGLVTRDSLRGAPIPGILGLGKISNEATTNKYDNVPARLKNEGHIKRNSFSIYLNSLNSGVGSILFGGVDSSRYIEPLYEIPMANESHLSVELSSVSLKLHGETQLINNTNSRAALLDTGTSFTYLPDSAFNAIVKALGATYNPYFGVYFVSNITEKTPSLAFNFSGAEIVVPAVEYILPVRLFTTEPTPAPYILSIFRSSEIRGLTILGANFLRSSYTVFDVTGNKIALAQAKYDVSSTSVQQIISEIPGATSAPAIKVF